MEFFGRYKLLRRIAVGGMGELFLAERPGIAGFSKQLVVKRIRPSLAHDENFVEMFLNEGRVAALINHANVVQIYELGQVDGTYFLAMEYVAGKNLEDVLEKIGGPLELGLAVRVILKICEALACAHEVHNAEGAALNLVHRDVSPPNVLLGYTGSVKLTDFGIAKVAQGKQTAVGVLKGKFAYLSPEQARGQSVDRRSDIYSLGLLLFEATTGKRAIPGEMDAEVLYAAANAQTRHPGQSCTGYPKELERIFNKATAKRKKQRYQNVGEFRSDLLNFSIQQGLQADASALSAMLQGLFAREIAESRELFTPHETTDVGLSNLPTVTPNSGASGMMRSLIKEDGRADLPDLLESGDSADLAETGEHWSTRPEGALPLRTSDLLIHKNSEATVETQEVPEGTEADYLDVTTEHSVDLPGLTYDDPTDPRATRPFPSVSPSSEPEVESDPEENLDESTLAIKERPSWFSALVSRTPVLLGLIAVACAGLVTLIVGLSGDNSQASLPDGTVRDAISIRDASVTAELRATKGLENADSRPVPSVSDLAVPDIAGADSVSAIRNTPRDAAVDSKRVRARERGYLRVTTSPPMVAVIGGRSIKRKVSLRPGRYTVRLTNREEGIHLARRVQIEAGKTEVLKIVLGRGRLSVKARPWAHVSVAGMRRGTTPMKPLSLYEGEYRVTLSSDGMKSLSRRVRIRKGQTTSLVHRFRQ